MMILLDIIFIAYISFQENVLSNDNIRIFMIMIIGNLGCIAVNTNIKIKMSIVKKRLDEISKTIKNVIKAIDTK